MPSKDTTTLLIICIIFLSLFATGHAVSSIAVMVLVSYALFLCFKGEERIGWHPRLYWLFIAYYFLLVVSVIWSADKSLFLEKIRIKSVLLGIPFSFLVFKRIRPEQFRKLTYFFVSVVLASSLYVLINYVHNFELILKEMLEGRPIPVPFRSHIRYSILVNIAYMMALHRANINLNLANRNRFYIWAVLSLLLFIFIQFLAVKVGMVMAFITIICFTIHKILQTRKFFIGVFSMALFCLISVLLLSRFPTVKNKIAYLKYDLDQYRIKDAEKYSDASRIISVKRGIDIIKEYPLLGVGEGNAVRYLMPDSQGDIKLPHNQFILTWAQNGILGFITLILLFSSSVFLSIRNKNWLLATLTFAIFFACMVESMLETQIGVLIFTLPWMIFSSLSNVHEE